MNERQLFDLYGIEPEDQIVSSSFMSGGYTFYIMPVEEMPDEEMDERYVMANHLHTKGEKGILIPIRNRQGGFVTAVERKRFVLLGMGSEMIENQPLGRSLAAFHYRGRSVNQSIRHLNRVGQWKNIWEKRVDQLEQAWQEILVLGSQNEFERIFIEFFPYFSGMSENAIQYLVDTEIDEQPTVMDGGTICHERFGMQSWLDHSEIARFNHHKRNSRFPGKNPIDWVFDHASRDIAEWIRDTHSQYPNTYHQHIETFVQEYFRAIHPSPFMIRLMYARLILPVHFFETIEQYFVTKSEGDKLAMEDKLLREVEKAKDYEQFLKYFFEMTKIPQYQTRIRVPEWLR